MELTPLRTAGLVAALIFAVVTLWLYRKGRIGNGDLLLRLLVFVVPLLLVSLQRGVVNWVLDELSFREGGGRRVRDATGAAGSVLCAVAYLPTTGQGRTRRA